jgi:hypothetical protein
LVPPVTGKSKGFPRPSQRIHYYALKGAGATDVRLVGSRAFSLTESKVRKEGEAAVDFDFYVVPPLPSPCPPTDSWRLEGWKPFPASPPGPDVDAILIPPAELKWRWPIWEELIRHREPGGLICRGLKAEKAWGHFWYFQHEVAGRPNPARWGDVL